MGSPPSCTSCSNALSTLSLSSFSIQNPATRTKHLALSRWETGSLKTRSWPQHSQQLTKRTLSRDRNLTSLICAIQNNIATTEDGSSVGGGNGKLIDSEGELQIPQTATTLETGKHENVTASSYKIPKKIDFDYGFQAKFLRTGPTVPRNVFKLAFENFGREWRALRRSYLFSELEPIREVEGGPVELLGAYAGRGFILLIRGLDKVLTFYDGLQEIQPVQKEASTEQDELRAKLKQLKLDNDKVWDRERAREQVQAPWWILGPYYFLCWMLDVIFENRPIQRFWFLETVARMPYFSNILVAARTNCLLLILPVSWARTRNIRVRYISMLHLYETLGWWRTGAEVRKVHFAEEWNEMHHLKIMESLGGDLEWGDRFFGQHAAFFYYWALNAMFLISPTVAYNFSELIESHAVDTYGEFCDENEELLKSLPPPPVALEYYESGDLYMYDEFQTSRPPESRRPKMDNLHDVFTAICGDEAEHVKTMVACQQLDLQIESPNRLKYKRKEIETEIPDRLP